MVELKLYQNNNQTSEYYKKWYARASYKEEIDINKLAKLLKSHNTNWSEGNLVGLLKDMVIIIREQTLMGNTVKIEDLAIFAQSFVSDDSPLFEKPETRDLLFSYSTSPRGRSWRAVSKAVISEATRLPALS